MYYTLKFWFTILLIAGTWAGCSYFSIWFIEKLFKPILNTLSLTKMILLICLVILSITPLSLLIVSTFLFIDFIFYYLFILIEFIQRARVLNNSRKMVKTISKQSNIGIKKIWNLRQIRLSILWISWVLNTVSV